MDNTVYGHSENRGCPGDNRLGFPHPVGKNKGAGRRIVHRWWRSGQFIHIPRLGKVAESCGFRPVSPLSTPLQLRRHSFHVLIYPIVRRRRRVLAPLVCRLRACGMRTSSAPREGSRTRETRATLWKRRSRRYARGMSHRWGASGGSESFFGSRTS